MPTKIRWGVLGAANIATKKVIPAMQKGQFSTMAAIASRDLNRARRAADDLGIEKAYGSYEELLADPDIDAVYNPLPNSLHGPWTLRAIEAGKHVLCEKPFASNADEAAQVARAASASGLIVMEAMHYRYHPLTQRLT